MQGKKILITLQETDEKNASILAGPYHTSLHALQVLERYQVDY